MRMKSIVQINIAKGEDGWYVAEGVDVGIVTQGKTLDELMANIKEAVELYFEDEDINTLGFVRTPSVLINYELLALAHD